MVLPQRITKDLVRILKKHKPWMSIHFTHPSEITPEVQESTARLADAGLPMGSQTVLLKGINDDPEVMKRLMHLLLKNRVKPYYLYQCDPIKGSGHFRTTVDAGLRIISELRGHTTGYATPMFVVDAPGGGGKVLISPDSVVGRDGDDLLLKNFEGKVYRYAGPGRDAGQREGAASGRLNGYPMRIGVTYDLKADYLAAGMDPEDAAEFDHEVTIDAICDALGALGHEPLRIGSVRALAARLVAGERWDAVFNICEGLEGYAREAQVPALLDAYGIPGVFSDALTLAVGLDKSWTKRIVRDQGVPTAPFALIETLADIAGVDLPYPLFLKPVAEGSGKGVSSRSLVMNAAELKRTAKDLLVRFGEPVLAETYLPGREFTVGITGTGEDAQVLGVMEVNTTECAEANAYGYDNKSIGKAASITPCPKTMRPRPRARWRWPPGARSAAATAEGSTSRATAWAARISSRRTRWPGINPESSDLVFLARFKGIPYRELIARIFASFLERHPELAARIVKEAGAGRADCAASARTRATVPSALPPRAPRRRPSARSGTALSKSCNSGFDSSTTNRVNCLE